MESWHNDNAANFSSGYHFSSHLVAYWPVCFERNPSRITSMKSTINAWISYSVKFQRGSSYWINTPIEDTVFMSSTGDGGNTFSTSSSKPYKGLGFCRVKSIPFFLSYFNTLGPVVWKPISANHGLNFNLGFIFFCSKAFSQIIFTIRASIHYINAAKRNKTEFAF